MRIGILLQIQWTCIGLVVATISPRGVAQGYVIFNNRVPGQVVAPIFGAEPADGSRFLTGNPTNGFPAGTTVYHGPLLAGTGFTAQLFAGPPGAPEQLTAVATTTFLTGAGSGFVQPPANPVVIPGVFPG